jgi:hypothetical protein
VVVVGPDVVVDVDVVVVPQKLSYSITEGVSSITNVFLVIQGKQVLHNTPSVLPNIILTNCPLQFI